MNEDKQRAFTFADSIIASRPKKARYLPEWKRQVWKQFRKSDPNLSWKSFLAKLGRIERFHSIVSNQVEV